MEALTPATVGVVVTANSLTAWSAREVRRPVVAQALSDRLYEALDPEVGYTVDILTTEDGLFKFLITAGERCHEVAIIPSVASTPQTWTDEACSVVIPPPPIEDTLFPPATYGMCNDLSTALTASP